MFGSDCGKCVPDSWKCFPKSDSREQLSRIRSSFGCSRLWKTFLGSSWPCRLMQLQHGHIFVVLMQQNFGTMFIKECLNIQKQVSNSYWFLLVSDYVKLLLKTEPNACFLTQNIWTRIYNQTTPKKFQNEIHNCLDRIYTSQQIIIQFKQNNVKRFWKKNRIKA